MSYPIDFYFRVASGNTTNLTSVNKFGSNLDIDTGSTPETIWSNGGEYAFASSSGSISVVSSSTDDDQGGTGALTIKVQGLNEDYKEVEEEFTMDGTDSVLSVSNKWLKVYRAFVTSAGSTESNVGIITITLGALTLATIPAAEGQTQMCIFAIPAGKNGYIKSFSGAIIRSGFLAGRATLGIYIRKNGVKRLIHEIEISTDGASTFDKVFITPIKVTEKSDIYVNALSVTQNNSSVFSSLNIIIQ